MTIHNHKTKYSTTFIYTLILTLLLSLFPSSDTFASTPSPTLMYRSHIQNIGWMGEVGQGGKSGTTGRSLRMEAFSIDITSNGLHPSLANQIEYRAHVSNIGWQSWVGNGQVAGTTGRSLAVEAIQIHLLGDLALRYDVIYQAHVSNIGWMDWVSNGAIAGTTGRALPMEAIRIRLLPRSGTNLPPSNHENPTSSQPGANHTPSLTHVSFTSHVQNVGWTNPVGVNQVVGTTGRGLRLEALRASISSQITGGIEYRSHVQNIGWQNWVSDNAISGTSGQSLRLEAVQFRLTGNLANHYRLYYRAHVQNHGWLDWARNGESAGSEGLSLRLEALEFQLVPINNVGPSNRSKPLLDRSNTQVGGAGIRALDPNRPMVALTFDDGPAVGNTLRIMNTLNNHGGRATFFVLGNRVNSHRSIIEQLHHHGHEVAGHSWNHTRLTTLPISGIQHDINSTQNAINAVTGSAPNFFRAPEGAINDNVRQAARNTGMTLIQWNIDPWDWQHRNANTTYNVIMSQVSDGSIIVLHDIHTATANAMDRVIPDLVARGFQLVTVSELLHFRGVPLTPGSVIHSAR